MKVMTLDQHAERKSDKLSCKQVLGYGSVNVMGRLEKTSSIVMTFSRQLRNM